MTGRPTGGPWFAAKRGLARAAGAVSRRSGRGGGTTLPGRLLLRMDDRALSLFAARLTGGVTIVSATNGKTTTAGMIAQVLAHAGRSPVHNRAGSNMHWGVATALLEQRGEEGLFEVDEAWLGHVCSELDADVVVLGNLFRDQLDRYGELERLAGEWDELVGSRAGRTGFVLNADDPLVAELGVDARGRPLPGITYFGIDDPSVALPSLDHARDATVSRRAGAPLAYDHAFVGHLGAWRVPGTPFGRPRPDVSATQVELHGMDGSTVRVATPEGELELRLPLPGLYNVYNALAALAAGTRLGVGLADIGAALEKTAAAFGRTERLTVGKRDMAILLVKNPAGTNEVLRMLALEAGRSGPLDLWLALNDRVADGRDVSWVWDADFEPLAGSVRSVTCSGTRAPEMALRLKYAGWPTDAIEVVDGVGPSLDRAIERGDGTLFALPTYTALLELRTLLARRGAAPAYWS